MFLFYGVGVTQAQHALREIGIDLKEERVAVKCAINPVAGRMPGHRNALLAEADVYCNEVFELKKITQNSPMRNSHSSSA